MQQPKCLSRVPTQSLLCIHSTWTRCVQAACLNLPPSDHSTSLGKQAGPVLPAALGKQTSSHSPSRPQKIATACGKRAGSIKRCQVKQGELGGLSEQSPMYYYNIYLKKPTLSVSSRQHLIKCVGLPGAPSSC